MNIMLYGAAGPGDRNSETLCRAAAGLLRRRYPEARAFLASDGFDAELPGLAGYFRHPGALPPFSRGWLRCAFYKNFLRDEEKYQRLLLAPVIEAGSGMDTCISLAGSDYRSGLPNRRRVLDRALFERRVRLELWNAAFDPAHSGAEMRRDLNLFDRIVAGDSISFKALTENGFGAGTVLLPPLAFALEPQRAALPEGYSEGGTVGLCIGPRGDKFFQAVTALIDHILKSTYFSVVLIPYATAPYGQDGEALCRLAGAYKSDPAAGRILSAGNGYNAPETRWLFSRMRMLVTTHTPAAAAAMAGLTPALLVNSGARARGVMCDTLGDAAEFCLISGAEPSGKDLIRGFSAVIRNEDAVQALLHERVPLFRRSLEEGLILHR
ncbi:MAG: hypothetical protein P4M02_04465 [Clostridia bacterium]|nr:hypothetical protein [Clostridia bacterium]